MVDAEFADICRNPTRSVSQAKGAIQHAAEHPSPDKIPLLLVLNSKNFAALKSLHEELIAALYVCAELDPEPLWRSLTEDWEPNRKYAALNVLLKMPSLDTGRLIELGKDELSPSFWHRIERWASDRGLTMPEEIKLRQQRWAAEREAAALRGNTQLHPEFVRRRASWSAQFDLASPPSSVSPPPLPGYGFQKTQLSGHLTAILDYLRRFAPAVDSMMGAPYSAEQVARATARFPFKLSEEVYELYAWHNGVQAGSQVTIVPEYSFLPVEEAMEHYDRLSGHPAWNEHWFPLFNWNAEMLCSQCGPKETAMAPLVTLDTEPTYCPVAPSLTAFFARVQDRMGFYPANSEGRFLSPLGEIARILYPDQAHRLPV